MGRYSTSTRMLLRVTRKPANRTNCATMGPLKLCATSCTRAHAEQMEATDFLGGPPGCEREEAQTQRDAHQARRGVGEEAEERREHKPAVDTGGVCVVLADRQ